MANHPHFTTKTLELLDEIRAILQQYAGVPITVRQMFYRLVAANIIENNQRQYVRVSRVLTKARKFGYISPRAFVDRTRETYRESCWADLPEFLRAVKASYRRDPWTEQGTWPEVWLEKEALGSLFEPICNRHCVTLCITRGRPSFSYMWEAQIRWSKKCREGKDITIFYFGDFDPTGVAIPQNIQDEWIDSTETGRRPIELKIICLTREQAIGYPQAFVKEADPNTKAFVERYGDRCVELDAIPPNELQDMVEVVINNAIEQDQWTEDEHSENQEKDRLTEIIDDIG